MTPLTPSTAIPLAVEGLTSREVAADPGKAVVTSRGTPRRGRCTACHEPAVQAPTGRWWHLGDPCRERSTVIVPGAAFYTRPEFEALP
jgi:hypothetical protein